MANLATLLAPFPFHRFTTEVRGRRPLHTPCGWPPPFRVEDLDALIAAIDLRAIDARHPPIRAVRPHHEWPTAALCDDAGFADLSRIQAAFREGATVVLSQVDRRREALGAWCAAVAGGPPPPANLYWTPPYAQGFEAHTDPVDAIFLQLHGAKRWVLRGPAGAESLLLRAGEMLYVPRGWLHEGRAEAEPSLHLTVAPEPWVPPPATAPRAPAGWTVPLTEQTRLRRPPSAMVRVLRDPSGLQVDRVASTLRCPEWAEAALRRALQGEALTVADLPLPVETGLPLLRRLLAEGLLEPLP